MKSLPSDLRHSKSVTVWLAPQQVSFDGGRLPERALLRADRLELNGRAGQWIGLAVERVQVSESDVQFDAPPLLGSVQNGVRFQLIGNRGRNLELKEHLADSNGLRARAQIVKGSARCVRHELRSSHEVVDVIVFAKMEGRGQAAPQRGVVLGDSSFELRTLMADASSMAQRPIKLLTESFARTASPPQAFSTISSGSAKRPAGKCAAAVRVCEMSSQVI